MKLLPSLSLFISLGLGAACGSSLDRMNTFGKQPTANAKQKIILAYEIARKPGEKLRSISQRYQVPLELIERFNPREGQGRRKNLIYIPVQGTRLVEPAPAKTAPKIVKLMRDPFLRPIKLGDWSALEEQNFQSLEDWFVPDEAQRLSFPVEGYISSGFYWRWNRFHKGLDMAARAGSPITAAQDGQVSYRGWKAGYGLLVVLQHKEGRTYYAHCQSTRVKVGQKVSRGDLIARVGSTGHSFGSHLHFEYRDNQGQVVDPTPFLMQPCTRPVALSAQPARGSMGSTSWSAKTSLCQNTEI